MGQKVVHFYRILFCGGLPHHPPGGGGGRPPSDHQSSDEEHISVSGGSSRSGSPVSTVSSHHSDRRANTERHNKRYQIRVICGDAIAMARSAMDTGKLGHVKSAIEKVKAASQLYNSALGLGVEVHEIQVTHNNGINETLSPREALCTLQNDLFVKEQSLIKKEKDEYEKGKFLQTITKEHIISESLPHLEISASTNNIVHWVSHITSKFPQVQKDSPQ